MAGTLIAAFGNELRGDDGFGIAVLRRLEAEPPTGDGIVLLEVGTGGIRLAQELLATYDRLIIVDAMRRGGPPGTVYVREVESVEAIQEVDLHLATPGRALSVAKALGALPRQVFLVGCEPLEVDELTTDLSSPVRAAIETALRSVKELAAEGATGPCPSRTR